MDGGTSLDQAVAYRCMSNPYYTFSEKGFKYIVLDGNDKEYEGQKGYRSFIGKKQLKWLKNELEKATRLKEKVIIFGHHPIYPFSHSHGLWNAEDVIHLIEPFQCVKAYFNGHAHSGGYGRKSGIYYINLKGVVETPGNAYAIIKLYNNSIEIEGYGEEESRICPIR
jgi:3',5'-cyclic AMP phosphodiesterase CpdA